MLTRSLQQRHGRSIRTTVRTTIAIRRRRWNVRALYTRVCRYRNDGPFDFAHGVWTRSTPCVAQDQTLEAHGCFARDDINDEYIDSHRSANTERAALVSRFYMPTRYRFRFRSVRCSRPDYTLCTLECSQTRHPSIQYKSKTMLCRHRRFVKEDDSVSRHFCHCLLSSSLTFAVALDLDIHGLCSAIILVDAS